MDDVMDLTGEQIREAARNAKIEREPMVVPELGGRIWVRGMSGKERDKFDQYMRQRTLPSGKLDMREFRPRFASRVIVDKAGQRVLNDSDGDIELLGRLPVGILDRIIAKSNDLSGTTKEEADDLGNASASPAASDASS